MRRQILILGLVVALGLVALWLTGEFSALQPWLLDQQRAVQNRLAGAVRALRGGQPGALVALLTVCFGYGVLHAAGPGHRRLLIGGYGVAQRVRLLPLAAVAGCFAMGLGTACVTVAVAALAVWAREGAFASLPGAGSGQPGGRCNSDGAGAGRGHDCRHRRAVAGPVAIASRYNIPGTT